jgi:Protein of unknown function (DUF2474)
MRAGAARPSSKWLVRLAWLAVFWVSGVAGMGLVAFGLRTVMRAVGLA